MKTFIQTFALFLGLLVTVQATAQRTLVSPSATPASVIKNYYNMAKSGKCVGFTIATNERAKKVGYPVPHSVPTSTWATGILNDNKAGSILRLKATNVTRYWSSRTHGTGNNPFNPNKTDQINLTFKLNGTKLIATLSKPGSSFKINVINVMKGPKGDLLYGTYTKGGFTGFITISIFESGCPVG